MLVTMRIGFDLSEQNIQTPICHDLEVVMFGSKGVMTGDRMNKIQTQKRLKRTLFIRTKHNMQIFGVIPFIVLQNDSDFCFSFCCCCC